MHSLKRDNAETESMTIQETGVEQRKKHNGKTQEALMKQRKEPHGIM